MKKIFMIMAMVTLAFGCSKKEETKTVTTASGQKIEVPTTTTYYYYSSPLDGRSTTYLLIKDISTAEVYRPNDTLIADLTSDEKDEFSAALKGIPTWNQRYEKNSVNEFEEIRKIAPEGETNIYHTFGSPVPAEANRLLKACMKIADRLRREKGGERLPV